MQDAMDQELKKGDIVICASKSLDKCKLGCKYKIDDIFEATGSLTLCGMVNYFKSMWFLKLNEADVDIVAIPIDQTADAIIKLINSKPWSPSRQDIVELLEANLNNLRTIKM